MGIKNGTQTHCPRGTLRTVETKGAGGRCVCQPCIKYRSADNTKRNKQNRRRSYELLANARARAKLLDLPCDITEEDCKVPAFCPILGIPLFHGAGKLSNNSPTMDRIIPELGYVRGNVAVISHRANRIKSDASLGDLRAVVRWMESL